MITVKDIGKRISFHLLSPSDYYIKEKRLLLSSDYSASRKYNGEQYLEIICDEATFDELLQESKKLLGYDHMFALDLFEFPQKCENESGYPRGVTGRVYCGREEYYDDSNNGLKKYIKPNDKQRVITSPITWLLDQKERRIISLNRLFTKEQEDSIEATLKQEVYTPNIMNYQSPIFTIKNGCLTHYNRNSLCGDAFPRGIKGINMDWNPNSAIYEIHFNKEINRFNIHNPLQVDRLFLYDNTTVESPISVGDDIWIDYNSFDSLVYFLRINSETIKKGKGSRYISCYIRGPALTFSQKREIKTFKICGRLHCFKKSPYSSDTDYYKEHVELEDESKPTIEDLWKLLNEHITIFSNFDKIKSMFQERVNVYNNLVSQENTNFSQHIPSLYDLEEEYNKLRRELIAKFGINYLQMIDFIDECILYLHSEIPLKNNNNLFSTLVDIILPQLKDELKDSFMKIIKDLLNETRNKIIDYINCMINNPHNTPSLEYHTVNEFNVYLEDRMYLIMLTVAVILSDGNNRKDWMSDIMLIISNNIKTEQQKVNIENIRIYLDLLVDAQKSLEEKIPISPFAEEFMKDYTAIKKYLILIGYYLEVPNLRRIIYKNCSSLRRLIDIEEAIGLSINDNKKTAEINEPNLIPNSDFNGVESSAIHDLLQNGVDVIKLSSALRVIILAMKSLEREVDKSIAEKEKILKYGKIKLG